MTQTFTSESTYEVTTCCKCGFHYAAPQTFLERQRDVGGSHYCVSCGQFQGWRGGRTRLAKAHHEVAALKGRLAVSQRESDLHRLAKESAQRRLRSTRGVVTRIKNRVSKGICPCCNRHFVNVQRHMERQHPDFSS